MPTLDTGDLTFGAAGAALGWVLAPTIKTELGIGQNMDRRQMKLTCAVVFGLAGAWLG